MNDAQLIPASEAPDLDTMKRAASPTLWIDYKAQAEKLKLTAETLTVTSVQQVAEIKLARATRLALKSLRLEVETKRVELGEHHLLAKRKIDSDAKDIKAIIEPLEERLLEQEKFAEREAARIVAEKRTARVAELTPFLAAPVAIDLGAMEDDAYAGLLSDSKGAHAARIEREERERTELAAKEKAESEERARIQLENARLKAEAIEREAEAQKERDEAAATLKAEQDRAAAEAKTERERVAKEKADAEEVARKERLRLQAVADVERQKADAARVAAEAKAKIDREAREALERKAAQAKALQDQEDAKRVATEKAAAAAPDREKLNGLATRFRNLTLPEMSSESGKEALPLIRANIDKLATWIEAKGAAL